MKKTILFLALAVLGTAEAAGWKYKWPVIVPEVQEKTFKADVQVKIEDGVVVSVSCADGAKMSGWVAAKFAAWFGVKAKVQDVAFAGTPFPNAGGYSLTAKAGALALGAQTAEGVRYAMSTLRQLAQPQRGTLTVKGWEVPELTIRDWPEISFRGLHLCAFPELSLVSIEHQIRMAAYYKYNYVVLEPWGTYRSEKYPWYGFRNGKLTTAECRRLAKIAADLGVKLIPELNVFGHATAARVCAGKNAILYHAPEYAPLFEPGNNGWNWCLSNPETRKVQEGMLEEMYEAFGRPGYVHLGCDEANGPSCSACCAVPYWEVVSAHVRALNEKAAKLGARPMVWHDMLLARNDARWRGFYQNGAADAEKLLTSLPKSLVVCDWYYGSPRKDGAFPTLDYFQKQMKFTTLTCPWNKTVGIRAQCAYARTHSLDGVLQTMWHHYTGPTVRAIYTVGAAAAWSAKANQEQGTGKFSDYSTHWRQTANDTPGGDAYEEQGWYSDQVRSECPWN